MFKAVLSCVIVNFYYLSSAMLCPFYSNIYGSR